MTSLNRAYASQLPSRLITTGQAPRLGSFPIAMSDAEGNGGTGGDSPDVVKQSASKDRNCPYCGQAFTSSSLGRHLDLYIKEKNPKPPDGIHDVEAIRKMRGSITRRQPRGSLARRDSSNPGASTPTSAKRTSPGPDQNMKNTPSGIPKEGQFVVDHQAYKYPFQPTWEATGVILDIPPNSDGKTPGWDDGASQGSTGSRKASLQQQPPPQQQRGPPSRAVQKAQLDARQRLSDAVDTARAAELALREILSSWRAAK